MKTKNEFHNRSRKPHARLMHSLSHLDEPGVQKANLRWNQQYHRGKWGRK